MDFPCAAHSCIVFTVLLLIMAASCVHAESHAPQLTAISWGGQFYPGAIIHRRLYHPALGYADPCHTLLLPAGQNGFALKQLGSAPGQEYRERDQDTGGNDRHEYC